MKDAQFVCKRCGKFFVVPVLEPGEAEKRRVRSVPVQCPECNGPVERKG